MLIWARENGCRWGSKWQALSRASDPEVQAWIRAQPDEESDEAVTQAVAEEEADSDDEEADSDGQEGDAEE